MWDRTPSSVDNFDGKLALLTGIWGLNWLIIATILVLGLIPFLTVLFQLPTRSLSTSPLAGTD